jgi:hypothetical protein
MIMKIKNILMLFLTMHTLNGAPGCMSQSQQLQRYDTKDYHYVHCDCPCAKRYKVLADRGKCTRCFHFRDAQSTITISAQDTIEAHEMAAANKKQPSHSIGSILKKAAEEQALSF